MKALADEDAALDDAIAGLLGPAEAALLQSRAHLNEVTDSAFAVHLRQEAEKGAPVPPSA